MFAEQNSVLSQTLNRAITKLSLSLPQSFHFRHACLFSPGVPRAGMFVCVCLSLSSSLARSLGIIWHDQVLWRPIKRLEGGEAREREREREEGTGKQIPMYAHEGT